MANNQLIKNWLDKADDDLAFAKGLSLKKIHDLMQLVQICKEDDPEFNKYYDAAKILNPFYIGTRYPDFIISVNKSNAEKALQVTEEIAVFTKSKLSPQSVSTR